MNKINALFVNNKDRKLLSLYFCAGCPTFEGTGAVIKSMERHGIDMIEVAFLSVTLWLTDQSSRVQAPKP